jgi:hypothetical protein
VVGVGEEVSGAGVAVEVCGWEVGVVVGGEVWTVGVGETIGVGEGVGVTVGGV